MADNSYKLVNGQEGLSETLGVISGTQGPHAVDVRKLYRDTGVLTYDPGFMSTASCESRITYIDGEAGILEYRGYPIEQLAEQSTYLEVAYLLLYGDLPNRTQLQKFEQLIVYHTMLNETLKNFYDGFHHDSPHGYHGRRGGFSLRLLS